MNSLDSVDSIQHNTILEAGLIQQRGIRNKYGDWYRIPGRLQDDRQSFSWRPRQEDQPNWLLRDKRSYAGRRSFQVRIGNMSNSREMKAVLPLSAVLSPKLYFIYAANLPKYKLGNNRQRDFTVKKKRKLHNNNFQMSTPATWSLVQRKTVIHVKSSSYTIQLSNQTSSELLFALICIIYKNEEPEVSKFMMKCIYFLEKCSLPFIFIHFNSVKFNWFKKIKCFIN